MSRKRSEALTVEPPPMLRNPEDWVSATEAARLFGRSVRTIQWWCLDGVFAEFGYKVYRDVRGIWHINIPLVYRKRTDAIRAAAAATV